MYLVILEKILCILLWIRGQNLSSEIRVRGMRDSLSHTKRAFLRWGSVGVPAERRTSLYSSVYGEAGKLPSILSSFDDSTSNKKAHAHTTRELYIQQLYHCPCVLSQHRLARWNNDGAETYGGLARLALIHHICLRPATMTASRVEDGLVCVGWQSWTVGVGIDQSTPT